MVGLKLGVRNQLKKIYNGNIRFQKIVGEYIYWQVTTEKGIVDVRVEMDFEDHDWWVEEGIDGVWNNINIITI